MGVDRTRRSELDAASANRRDRDATSVLVDALARHRPFVDAQQEDVLAT